MKKQNQQPEKTFIKGSIFFRFPEELLNGTKDITEVSNIDIERVRVIRFKNQTTVVVKDLETKKVFTIDSNVLLNEYALLMEDAVIAFTETSLGNGKNKTRDCIILGVTDKSEIPYFGARQCINNFYASIVNNEIEGYKGFEMYGMSMTYLACPEGFEYMSIFALDNIGKSEYIAYYKEDSLDTILELIDVEYFNKIFEENFKAHCTRNGYRFDEAPVLDGYTNDLKYFMQFNDVMADIRRGVDVVEVAEVDLTKYLKHIKTADESFGISDEDMVLVQSKIYDRIGDYTIFLYNRNVDFSQIKIKYKVLADSQDNLFILTYHSINDLKMEELSIDKNLSESEKLDIISKLIDK